MKIVIQGDPIAKQRHRHAKNGRKVMTYDPQSLIAESVKIMMQSKVRQEGDCFDLSGSFDIIIWFYFKPRKSLSTSQKNAKLWGFEFHDQKPDYDNLAKFIGDCGNGVLWKDDSQIVSATCHKLFDEEPRVEIEINARRKPQVKKDIEEILNIISPFELKEMSRDFNQIRYIGQIETALLADEKSKCQVEAFCAFLSKISDKHLNVLKKISLKCKNDLSSELDEYIKKKQHETFGHDKPPF